MATITVAVIESIGLFSESFLTLLIYTPIPSRLLPILPRILRVLVDALISTGASFAGGMLLAGMQRYVLEPSSSARCLTRRHRTSDSAIIWALTYAL